MIVTTLLWRNYANRQSELNRPDFNVDFERPWAKVNDIATAHGAWWRFCRVVYIHRIVFAIPAIFRRFKSQSINYSIINLGRREQLWDWDFPLCTGDLDFRWMVDFRFWWFVLFLSDRWRWWWRSLQSPRCGRKPAEVRADIKLLYYILFYIIIYLSLLAFFYEEINWIFYKNSKLPC